MENHILHTRSLNFEVYATAQLDNIKLHKKVSALEAELSHAKDGQKTQQELFLKILDILALQATQNPTGFQIGTRSSEAHDFRFAELRKANADLEDRCSALESYLAVVKGRLDGLLTSFKGTEGGPPLQDKIGEASVLAGYHESISKNEEIPDLLCFDDDSNYKENRPRKTSKPRDASLEGHRRALRHFTHPTVPTEVGGKISKNGCSTQNTASSTSLQNSQISTSEVTSSNQIEDRERRSAMRSYGKRTQVQQHLKEAVYPGILDSLNFGKFGIEYKPLTRCHDTFRTVLLEGLSAETTVREILELVHGGVVISVHAADALSVTGQKSAIVIFACGEAAKHYVDYHAVKPLQLGGNLCQASLLPSETFPSSPRQQMRLAQGYTRCFVACNIPQHLTLDRVVRELNNAFHPFHSGIIEEIDHDIAQPKTLEPTNTVYEYYLKRSSESTSNISDNMDDDDNELNVDRFIHMPFVSVKHAEAAADKLRELPEFGDCSIIPAPDPCDRFMSYSPSPRDRAFPHGYRVYKDLDRIELENSLSLDYDGQGEDSDVPPRNSCETVPRIRLKGRNDNSIGLENVVPSQHSGECGQPQGQPELMEDHDRREAPDNTLYLLHYGDRDEESHRAQKATMQFPPALSDSTAPSDKQDLNNSVASFESQYSDNPSIRAFEVHSEHKAEGITRSTSPSFSMQQASSTLPHYRKITRYVDSDNAEDMCNLASTTPPPFGVVLHNIAKKPIAHAKSRSNAHDLDKIVQNIWEQKKGAMTQTDGSGVAMYPCNAASSGSCETSVSLNCDVNFGIEKGRDLGPEQSLRDHRMTDVEAADKVELDY